MTGPQSGVQSDSCPQQKGNGNSGVLHVAAQQLKNDGQQPQCTPMTNKIEDRKESVERNINGPTECRVAEGLMSMHHCKMA